jgi:23S rRNA-/tRNA-specific pseudouridylate synthase
MRRLYADEHVVAIDKPSGLAVHRGLAADRDTVASRLAGEGLAGASHNRNVDARCSSRLVIVTAITPAASTS